METMNENYLEKKKNFQKELKKNCKQNKKNNWKNEVQKK